MRQRDPSVKHRSTIALVQERQYGSQAQFHGARVMDNRHGLVASGCVTQADGYAEREAKAMLGDVRQVTPDDSVEITIGADKGYDAAQFIEVREKINVTPHVAQNSTNRKSAVARSIASTVGYAISIQKRKLIEQVLG